MRKSTTATMDIRMKQPLTKKKRREKKRRQEEYKKRSIQKWNAADGVRKERFRKKRSTASINRKIRLQVIAWMKNNDFSHHCDGKHNIMYLEFAKAIGHPLPNGISGSEIRQAMRDMYLSSVISEIGRKDTAFYSSAPWLSLRFSVLMKYGEVCMKCGSTHHIAVDHIKPRSLYPLLELEFNNMQVLCRSCNSSKSNREIVDYRG